MSDISVSRFLSIIVMLFSASQVLAEKHQHTPSLSVPSGCDTNEVLPQLRCARTPNATFDHNGRLWLVWVVGQHLYVSHSDDKSKTYSKAVKVNNVPETIAARGENRPKIVVDVHGRIYISWTQKLKKRFSGHIRFSRSLDGGKSFSEPITVNDHLEVTSHRFESMAVNEKGEIFLAWLDKRDKLAMKQQGKKYPGAALYFAVSRDNGKTFSKNKKVIDHTCECCRTGLAIDLDQLPVVVWRHIFGNNIRDHALVKLHALSSMGDVQRVSYDNWQIDGCPHHGPAISIANDGVYHLVWFNNAPESHGLFYANSNDQGQHFSRAISFGNYQAQASHPHVLSKDNNVYLAWNEFDGKKNSLLVMTSNNKGKHWSAPRRLVQTDGALDYPLLLSYQDSVYVASHQPGQEYRLVLIKDN